MSLGLGWLFIALAVALAADLIIRHVKRKRATARALSMAAHPAGRGLTPMP